MLTFMFTPTIYFELIFCILSEIEVKVYCFLHGSQAQIIEKNLIPTGWFWSLCQQSFGLSPDSILLHWCIYLFLPIICAHFSNLPKHTSIYSSHDQKQSKYLHKLFVSMKSIETKKYSSGIYHKADTTQVKKYYTAGITGAPLMSPSNHYL